MAKFNMNDPAGLAELFADVYEKQPSVQRLTEMMERNPAAWRKEYTRMRDIEVKRIKRAHAKGELLYIDLPPKLSEIQSSADLARAYKHTSKFLESPRATAAGRRDIAERTVESLNEAGYENVNTKNLKQFGDFMDFVRAKYTQNTPDGKKMLVGSDFAAEAFDKIREKFTSKTNKSAMSRAFNRYLRDTGNENLII